MGAAGALASRGAKRRKPPDHCAAPEVETLRLMSPPVHRTPLLSTRVAHTPQPPKPLISGLKPGRYLPPAASHAPIALIRSATVTGWVLPPALIHLVAPALNQWKQWQAP